MPVGVQFAPVLYLAMPQLDWSYSWIEVAGAAFAKCHAAI